MSTIVDWPYYVDGVDDAREQMRAKYRLNRTEGQPWTIIIAVEKAGMVQQLRQWFTDDMGLPLFAIGGYASQTVCTDLRRHIEAIGKPAALIGAYDYDPTGEDLDRDFVKRVGVFDKVIRVALSDEQVAEYNLPLNKLDAVTKKLEDDPRSRGFVERHGKLVQYELDALAPETLRDLYREAINGLWVPAAYEAVLATEDEQRRTL